MTHHDSIEPDSMQSNSTHLLASDWLQRMIAKNGHDPRTRLLALFEILQDWVNAPGLRELLLSSSPFSPRVGISG